MKLEMGASFADASRVAVDSVVCTLPKPPQHGSDLEQAKEKQLPEPRSPGAPLFVFDPNHNLSPLGSLSSGDMSPSSAPFEQPGRDAALAPNWEGRIPVVVDKVLELKRVAMEDLRAQIYAQHGAAAFAALTAQMDEQLPTFVRDPLFSLEEFKEILVLTKSVIDEKAADISKAKRVEAYLQALRQTAPVSSSPGEAPESPLVNRKPKSPSWNESVGLPSLSLVPCPAAASQPPSASSRASAGLSANPLRAAPFSAGGSGESISITLRRPRSLSPPSGSSPASPAAGFGGGVQGDWNHNVYDPESHAEELRGAHPLPKRPATWGRKRQRASCVAGANSADPSCNSKHPAGFDEQRWFVPVDSPSENNATVQSASVGEAAPARRKGRPHCAHCNVYGHFIETCFDLHPHLRGSRSQLQRPHPKRMNNAPAVVTHATQVPMPSPVTEVARPRGRRPFCSNCNRNGHYLDRCFRLYPHLRSEQRS